MDSEFDTPEDTPEDTLEKGREGWHIPSDPATRPTYGPFPQQGKGSWIDKRKPKFSEEFLVGIFQQFRGQLILIADHLGITVSTLKKYKKRYPILEVVEKYEKKKLLPKAINRMWELMEQDDDKELAFKAAKHILTFSPEGKEAGWGHQKQIQQQIEITKTETKTLIGPEILQQLLENVKKDKEALDKAALPGPILEHSPGTPPQLEIGLKELPVDPAPPTAEEGTQSP